MSAKRLLLIDDEILLCELMKRNLQRKADGLISKPISHQELHTVIEEALASAEAEGAHRHRGHTEEGGTA